MKLTKRLILTLLKQQLELKIVSAIQVKHRASAFIVFISLQLFQLRSNRVKGPIGESELVEIGIHIRHSRQNFNFTMDSQTIVVNILIEVITAEIKRPTLAVKLLIFKGPFDV
jgi:hypothetical protein